MMRCRGNHVRCTGLVNIGINQSPDSSLNQLTSLLSEPFLKPLLFFPRRHTHPPTHTNILTRIPSMFVIIHWDILRKRGYISDHCSASWTESWFNKRDTTCFCLPSAQRLTLLPRPTPQLVPLFYPANRAGISNMWTLMFDLKLIIHIFIQNLGYILHGAKSSSRV